jgi:hypothetical protein
MRRMGPCSCADIVQGIYSSMSASFKLVFQFGTKAKCPHPFVARTI